MFSFRSVNIISYDLSYEDKQKGDFEHDYTSVYNGNPSTSYHFRLSRRSAKVLVSAEC